MKYIRTKDGIIYRMVQIGYGQYRAIDKNGNLLFGIEGKQADTIEELCDDFIGVLDNGNGSHIWYDDEYLGIDYADWETPEELSVLKFKYAKSNNSLNEVLYGAIWTDKGLIYVAKMNEKGELELL